MLSFSARKRRDRDRYETMPLAELPPGEVARVRRQAHATGRLGRPDGKPRLAEPGKHPGRGLEGTASGRGGSRCWRKRFIFGFARRSPERKFDQAIRTAKTMFALSRHLGEHPTEVANLVGLWVAHIGLNTPRRNGAAGEVP